MSRLTAQGGSPATPASTWAKLRRRWGSEPLEAEVLVQLQRRAVPEVEECGLVEVLQALEDALGDRFECPTGVTSKVWTYLRPFFSVSGMTWTFLKYPKSSSIGAAS